MSGSRGRPACAVRVFDLAGEKRPRYSLDPGLRSEVRAVGKLAGLRRMGVSVRSIPSGFAGTPRHFHTVEEEWVYVLSGTGAVRIGPHRIRVSAGSFVGFPPGPAPHHFLSEGDPSAGDEPHTHTRTDEWVYILAGRARVRVGDARFEVSAGDFLGHPAGGPARWSRSPSSHISWAGWSTPTTV